MGGTNIKNINIRKLIAAVAMTTALACTAGAMISAGAPHAAAETPAPTPGQAADLPASSPSATPSRAPTAAEIHESAVEKLLGPRQPQLSTDEKNGIINILLIGTDERLADSDDLGRGDVTMLCSLDKTRGTVKLVSFERSTAVPWPGHGDVMLTNSYAYGGAELTKSCVENCFHVGINGYVHMDFEGFKDIINAIGGIDIELTRAEAEALTEDTYNNIWFSEGMNHLDGDGALRYCRLRRIDDNWARVARQRTAVQAMLAKAKTLGLAEISNLAEVLLPLIDTDLSKRELASLLISAPKFMGAEAEQMTIPDREHIWMYDGADESVTGCNYGAESTRLREFLYSSES